MRPDDGRDLMFAGAGLVWGLVTLFRGVQVWRLDRRVHPRGFVGALPAATAEGAGSLVSGLALVVGCSAYVLWSLWRS